MREGNGAPPNRPEIDMSTITLALRRRALGILATLTAALALAVGYGVLDLAAMTARDPSLNLFLGAVLGTVALTLYGVGALTSDR